MSAWPPGVHTATLGSAPIPSDRGADVFAKNNSEITARHSTADKGHDNEVVEPLDQPIHNLQDTATLVMSNNQC
jgi:hypothetical protein